MPPANYKSSFTNDELATLRRAFDLACADLGLDPADAAPREHLSALLFQVAQTGVMDCLALKAIVVERFRIPVAGCRNEAGPPAPSSAIPPASDEPRPRPPGR